MWNLNPEMSLPKELHGNKLCGWSSAYGVDVKVSFPKSVFANDEVIAFNADITNQTGKTVEMVSENFYFGSFFLGMALVC